MRHFPTSPSSIATQKGYPTLDARILAMFLAALTGLCLWIPFLSLPTLALCAWVFWAEKGSEQLCYQSLHMSLLLILASLVRFAESILRKMGLMRIALVQASGWLARAEFLNTVHMVSHLITLLMLTYLLIQIALMTANRVLPLPGIDALIMKILRLFHKTKD